MLQMIPEAQGSKLKGVNIVFGSSDNDQRINMSTGVIWSKQDLQAPEKIFDLVNIYWSKLDYNKQQAIFNQYEELAELIATSAVGTQVGYRKIVKICKTLVELHPWDDFYTVIQRNAMLHIPTTIYDTVPERYKFQPRAKTYTRDEYIPLACFVHYFRFMLPVVTSLLRELKSTLGKDECERAVLRVLNTTELRTLTPYKRLMEYIDSFFIDRTNEYNGAITLSEISTEEVPDVVKSRILTRVIPTLEPDHQRSDIITSISSRVKRRIKDLKEGYNGNTFREKTPPKRDAEGDGKMSVFEHWKLTTDITSHHKALHNANAKDIFATLRLAMPQEDIDAMRPKLEEMIERTELRKLDTFNNPIMTTFGLPLLSLYGHEHTLGDISIIGSRKAQLVLVTMIMCHLGYEDLALACNYSCKPLAEGVLRAHELNIAANTILDKAIQDVFEDMYPYYTPEAGNKKRNKRNNFGFQAIDDSVQKLTKSDITAEGPTWLLSNYELSLGDVTSPLSNIKTRLAEFIITCYNLKPYMTEDDLLKAEFPDA